MEFLFGLICGVCITIVAEFIFLVWVAADAKINKEDEE
jgi:hypothetical protein